MPANQQKSAGLVVLLLAAAGLLPLLLYGLLCGQGPTLTPLQAAARLSAPGAAARLVDVRPATQYAGGHIEGAVNWPLASFPVIPSPADVPATLRDRTLFLICDGGVTSALAAARLNALGVPAYSIDGGIQSWVANAPQMPASQAAWRLGSGDLAPLPTRTSPPAEQAAATLGGFVIKPLYMLLALGLILALGRARAADLFALQWGLVAFLIGEAACWINFPIFHEEYPSLEYVHSLAMVVCVGFLTFAAVEALDRRVLRFSDPKAPCALAALCRGCMKTRQMPCGLERLLKILLLGLSVVALMPLNAEPDPVSYNTRVFGLFLNYSHAIVNQLYEIRFAPAAALVLMAAAWGALQFGRREDLLLSKVLMAAGVGHLSFAFLRLALVAFYRDNLVWFAFWEEATEFLLIAGLAAVLYIFRRGLEGELALPFTVPPGALRVRM